MFKKRLVTLFLIGITLLQSNQAPSKPNYQREPKLSTIPEYYEADSSFGNISFNISHKFKAKNINNNEMIDYCITNVPQSRIEEAVEFMAKYYIRGDPMSIVKYSLHEKIDIEQLKMLWWEELRAKTSVACFKCESNEFLAINILYVVTKKGKSDTNEYDSEELWSGMDAVNKFDVFTHYNVDKYMTSDGLVVHPDYRRIGIAKHLFTVIEDVCKKLNISVISAVFTSDWSNTIADQFKCDTNVEFNMADFYQKHPEIPALPLTKVTRRSKQYS